MAASLDFYNVYLMGSVEMLFQFYFFTKMLKKNIWFPWYFLFAGCAAAVMHFVPAGTIIEFGVFVLLLTASGIFACRADFPSSFLYAALTTEIMRLCYGIVKYVSHTLYLLLYNAFYTNALYPNASYPNAFYTGTELGMVFMFASEIVSLALTGCCYVLVCRYFSCYTAADLQQMFLVFIPILMLFLMSEYFNAMEPSVVIAEHAGPVEYLAGHWQLFAVHLLGLASLFCILSAYKKLLQNFRLRTELSLLEQQEHFLKQYVEEAKAHYEKTKAFRHDIRNHIKVMKELLRNGKWEQAVCYIGDLDERAETMSFPCSTNNPAADILVGNKLGIAKNMGVRVSCSLYFPYPCGLRDMDLCIVLSNALDNAIQACGHMDAGSEKYIHVSGRIQGDFLMIEVTNSFQGKGLFRKGTGLSNIKTVAEKYSGAVSIETQNHVFLLHVLLIIPQHPEDIPQQMYASAASCGRKKKMEAVHKDG